MMVEVSPCQVSEKCEQGGAKKSAIAIYDYLGLGPLRTS
jgi:hypothetical protein